MVMLLCQCLSFLQQLRLDGPNSMSLWRQRSTTTPVCYNLPLNHSLENPASLSTLAQGNDISNATSATAIATEVVFVFGFSSSGKSTYMERHLGLAPELVELAAFMAIADGFKKDMSERECSLKFDRWVQRFRKKSKSKSNVTTAAVVHMNLFELFHKKKTKMMHRFLRAIFNRPAPVRVIGIVASPQDLIGRMDARKSIENGKNVYQSSKFINRAKSRDLPAIFRFFVEEFLSDAPDIPIEYVASRPDFHFEPLPNLDAAVSTLCWPQASLDQVKQVRKKGIQGLYHTMPLPYNMTLRGSYDHKALRDVLFDLVPPKGQSILEIGAANGYFSLEAAKAGVKNIRSLEINPERITTAVKFKNLWGLDNVDFLPLNTMDEYWMTPFTNNRYDQCYLLNVIHHIPEPIRMLRLCARVAKSVVVMELPQPDDPTLRHFPVTKALPSEALDRQVPAIFVLNNPQTPFTLTTAAVRTILANDCQHFKETESPIAGRMILVCYKKQNKVAKE